MRVFHGLRRQVWLRELHDGYARVVGELQVSVGRAVVDGVDEISRDAVDVRRREDAGGDRLGGTLLEGEAVVGQDLGRNSVLCYNRKNLICMFNADLKDRSL